MSPYQPTHEFEQHVGLAVDPIPASPNRKRSMREELLAHLHGAFEQELADSRPPEIALATAMHRFGNLDLIRTELRQSVPLLERIIFQFLAPVFTPKACVCSPLEMSIYQGAFLLISGASQARSPYDLSQ